jgi:hypothetical protein
VRGKKRRNERRRKGFAEKRGEGTPIFHDLLL